MVRRLLIANRGEIAIRVARTAREMEIRTIGVHSQVDRGALHVRAMDEPLEIGGPRPAESYLAIERVIGAAQRSRADAIHPGYGFLAENPAFAARCSDEGILFVGPPAKAMALSGDKIASRRAMARAGVPVTAGMDRVVTSPDEAREIAEGLGYPVLFKATAGGGGIGMSRVDSPDRLAAAFEAARGVALANFGNPDLFLEKFVPRARHVEVQVVLGTRGTGVHLGERECSVQRRHQKLVEESPSPALSARMRARLGALAVKALRGIGYRNAGTVEFLHHGGKITFNEVNARLQVEHPVTEVLTGIDLVRQQLLVAFGEGLEVSQSEVVFHGHALECWINAEDPLRGFLPAPGRISGYPEPSPPPGPPPCALPPPPPPPGGVAHGGPPPPGGSCPPPGGSRDTGNPPARGSAGTVEAPRAPTSRPSTTPSSRRSSSGAGPARRRSAGWDGPSRNTRSAGCPRRSPSIPPSSASPRSSGGTLGGRGRGPRGRPRLGAGNRRLRPALGPPPAGDGPLGAPRPEGAARRRCPCGSGSSSMVSLTRSRSRGARRASRSAWTARGTRRGWWAPRGPRTSASDGAAIAWNCEAPGSSSTASPTRCPWTSTRRGRQARRASEVGRGGSATRAGPPCPRS